MTINKLHKILSKMIEDGCGRMQVVINKGTFNHPLEGDGVNHLHVEHADTEWIYLADDDGGIKELANGREAGSVVCVLYGVQKKHLKAELEAMRRGEA